MILINQFMILAKLYPDEAVEYENKAKALQMGFARHYEWLLPMSDEITEEDSSEVLAILEMFDAVQGSLKSNGKLSGEERKALKFRGFDANSESDQYSYANFLIKDEGRYKWLATDCEDKFLNSHMPVLEMYRRMLAKWNELGKPRSMDLETLKSIADARLV